MDTDNELGERTLVAAATAAPPPAAAAVLAFLSAFNKCIVGILRTYIIVRFPRAEISMNGHLLNLSNSSFMQEAGRVLERTREGARESDLSKQMPPAHRHPHRQPEPVEIP